MRVDFLIPTFPPAHWNFAFAMDVEGSKYSHPPLGAATLAAYAPDSVDVRIRDENVEKVELDSLAPVVCISAMYIQRERAFELARMVRASGRTVAIGGGLVGALPEVCEREADVVFRGEAELTWPKFLEDVAAGKPEASYKSTERFDMASSKTPRFDLLNLKAYSTGSVQTSRGCPYACEYCDVPNIDGPVPRTKTVEQSMREIEHLYAAGLRSIFIVDDHFLGHRRYATKLLKEIIRFVESKQHKPIFYCQATLNVARDEELLDALYRANFRRLFIGIETDDVEALKKANKAHNVQLPIVEAVRRIQEHNITVWAAMLAGFDEDTPETFDRYRKFVSEAQIGVIVPGILQAVPGTPYHDRVSAEERLVPLRNKYVAGQAGSLDSLLSTNVRPKHMTEAELMVGYQRFVKDLYEYDAYADRVMASLETGITPELGSATLKDVWDARGVLARTVRHYLWEGDSERRRFFVKFARFLLRTRFRRVDEAIFHMVIYKHLREFYFQASAGSVPLAEDVKHAS